MALNVVMLGPPGAGKGTQSERFAKTHGLPKIATGDILREAVMGGTPMGLAAQATIDAGELVSDDVMIGIVGDRLARPDTRTGFVLDGFPRTVAQAKALDRIMEGRGPLVVIDIVVPEEVLLRRLAARRICGSCGVNAPVEWISTCGVCGGALVHRSDDNDRIVLERLRVYHESTKPVVDYYRDRPTFRAVNGAQAPDLVTAEIEATIMDATRAGLGLPLGAQR